MKALWLVCAVVVATPVFAEGKSAMTVQCDGVSNSIDPFYGNATFYITAKSQQGGSYSAACTSNYCEVSPAGMTVGDQVTIAISQNYGEMSYKFTPTTEQACPAKVICGYKGLPNEGSYSCKAAS